MQIYEIDKEKVKEFIQSKKSLEELKAELELAHRVKNRIREMVVSGNLGDSFCAIGNTGEASKNYHRALAIAREAKDRVEEGKFLEKLGDAFFYDGLSPLRRKAIEYYERALDLAREIGDRRSEANHLGNLATCYILLGEKDKGLRCCEKGLALALEIQDRTLEGIWLDTLGNVFETLGDMDESVRFKNLARSVFAEVGKPQDDIFEKFLGAFSFD